MEVILKELKLLLIALGLACLLNGLSTHAFWLGRNNNFQRATHSTPAPNNNPAQPLGPTNCNQSAVNPELEQDYTTVADLPLGSAPFEQPTRNPLKNPFLPERPPVAHNPNFVLPAVTGRTPRNPTQIDESQFQPSQIHPSQVHPSQVHPSQVHPSQIHPSQVHPSQVHPSQVHPSQVHPSQVHPSQVHPSQVHPSQRWPAQRTPSQIYPTQRTTSPRPTQRNPFERNPYQRHPSRIQPTQSTPLKNPFLPFDFQASEIQAAHNWNNNQNQIASNLRNPFLPSLPAFSQQGQGVTGVSAGNPFLQQIPFTSGSAFVSPETNVPAKNPFLPDYPIPSSPRVTTVQPGRWPTVRPTQRPSATPNACSNTNPKARRPTCPPTTRPTAAPVLPVNTPAYLNSCQGPDLTPGICMPLEQCESMNVVYQSNPSDQNIKNFLVRSNQICGGQGTAVCCPLALVTHQPITAAEDDYPRTLPTIEEGCGHVDRTIPGIDVRNLVIGAEASNLGAWPWIALIGYNTSTPGTRFSCGGALITSRHVLTAAHCILPDLNFVRLGEHDLSTDSETNHIDVPVAKTIRHPQYSEQDGSNNIGLLILSENVQLSPLITPVCLQLSPGILAKPLIGKRPFIAGWGKAKDGAQSARTLQEMQIPIQNNSICQDIFTRRRQLLSPQQFDDSVICAGDLGDRADNCQGDSGGPLVIPRRSKNDYPYHLIGILSYSMGCARADSPAVYTKVSKYIDWIQNEIASGLVA